MPNIDQVWLCSCGAVLPDLEDAKALSKSLRHGDPFPISTLGLGTRYKDVKPLIVTPEKVFYLLAFITTTPTYILGTYYIATRSRLGFKVRRDQEFTDLETAQATCITFAKTGQNLSLYSEILLVRTVTHGTSEVIDFEPFWWVKDRNGYHPTWLLNLMPDSK